MVISPKGRKMSTLPPKGTGTSPRKKNGIAQATKKTVANNATDNPPLGSPTGPLGSPKGPLKSSTGPSDVLDSFPDQLQSMHLQNDDESDDEMFFATNDPLESPPSPGRMLNMDINNKEGNNRDGNKHQVPTPPSKEGRKVRLTNPSKQKSPGKIGKKGSPKGSSSQLGSPQGATDQDMHQEDTPANRAIKKSMGRPVVIRKSFKASMEREEARKTRKTAFTISDVVSSVMDEINLMKNDDDTHDLSADVDSSAADFNFHKQMHTHIDHRVIAGEDFTFADVLRRMDDNDTDLATIVLRQTGQNMKNFDILVDDDSGESMQKESVTLVLPMHLTASKLSDFAASIRHNTHLRFIDLKGNSLQDSSLSELATALKDNRKFRALDLSHNKITGAGCANLVQLVNRSLQFLNISYNPIGDAGAQKLAGGISNTTNLRELNIAECKIGDYGATFLATALAVNKSLQTIIMNGNNIGGEQASKRIAFALMRNQNLKVLKMGGNGLREGIEHFARLVETTKSLTSLDLSANGISDAGALSLGNALTMNRSIRTLCLKRNKIGDEGMAVISAALVVNNVLEVLDIGGNNIGDEGVGKLATVLSTHSKLRELDVSANNIGSDGAIELSDVLRSNDTLNILNIAQNPVGAAGFQRLEEALKINSSLQVCYVGVEAVGMDGIMEMTANYKNSMPFWESRLVVLPAKQLPTQAAVDELFFQDELRRTTFALAVAYQAPAQVLKSIVALVTLDAEKRNILDIVDLCLRRSLHHAAERHPDPAAIKLLVRHTHHPALLAKDTNGDTPLDCAIKYNKSPAVVTIMRTLTIACCLGHFEEMHGAYEEGRTTFATAVVGGAPVELLERMVELGEQDTKKRKITTVCDNEDLFPLQLAVRQLLGYKKYVERYPVHHAVMFATDIAILKPVIRDHAPDLLTEDVLGKTPLDYAKHTQNSPAVLPFVTEVDTALRNCDYPALLRLCGSTPDWEKKAQHYKDKKKLAKNKNAKAAREAMAGATAAADAIGDALLAEEEEAEKAAAAILQTKPKKASEEAKELEWRTITAGLR